MSIRQSPPPNLQGVPNPEFNKSLFDSSIWQKGYDCLVEKAIECPCRGGNENKALPSCQNCGGVGWVFINPVKTKAIMTSVNKDTKYKAWSQELLGNVNMTLRDIEQSGFMDRITILNETSVFSEVRKFVKEETESFVFLCYKIEAIEDVFIFESASKPLIRLDRSSYYILEENPYVLMFDNDVLVKSANTTVSIRYKHQVQYNILDIPNAIRSSNITNNLGQLEKIKLPNSYVARLAHYVLRPNFEGTNIINNTYEE